MIALAALLFAGRQVPPAADDPTMFPFVIPWDDALAGTATDVSFLNPTPAGRNGRIVAREGHFVESKTGRRVRFLGTNLTAQAAFPTHTEADRIAAHLAKYGINLVRFHHLQNNWGLDHGMIWKKDRIYLELDPDQLDRFDYLVAALKRRGIYSNINLQTSREYLPSMGFPDSVLQLKDYAKRIDKVDTRMIELQKEYAKQLLDRKNPYTGLTYAADPALMVVEINNENSLVGAPWESIDGLTSLPEPFRGEIVSAWNAWLSRKYGSTDGLRAAWSPGSTKPTSLTGPFSRWVFESQGEAKADGKIVGGGEPECAPAIDEQIEKIDGTDWHVQVHVDGLTLEGGQDYTLRFEIRADADRTISVGSNLDEPDWHALGLAGSAKVGTEWKQCSFAFTATSTLPGHCRVGITLGNAPGHVEVRRFQLLIGNVGGGLRPGESLEKGHVDLPEGGTKRQRIDFTNFLADTEKAYDTEMRCYLTVDLGLKANIVDTQIAWGGLTALMREADASFVDNHAYYNHPSFPGTPWDANNWFVPDTAMTDSMNTYGVLRDLALTRIAGKPYSISEYNHPAPNDHQAETMPLLASFAAIQDWDALYSFDYGTYGAGMPNDQIQGWFAVGSNPAKKALFPAAALMFRHGEIPAASGRAALELPPRPWELFKDASAAWAEAGPPPDLYAECASLGIGSKLAETTSTGSRGASVVDGTKGKIYAVDAPRAKVVTGSVGGRTVRLKGVTLEFPRFGDDFAVATVTPRDSSVISRSRDVLITLVGRVENQDMGWNKDRSSVGNRWGHGPVLCEGIPCTIGVRCEPGMAVFALGPTGRHARKVASTYSNGWLRFMVGPQQRTVWYEVEAVGSRHSAGASR